MKRFVLFFIFACFLTANYPAFSVDKVTNKKVRTYSMVENTKPKGTTVATPSQATTTTGDDLIQIRVLNDFDKPIKVQVGGGKKITIAGGEKIIIGNRAPGKYTFTVFNEKDEYVDSITKDINKLNSKGDFILRINDDTISNESKIDGLSTGQKVAIGAGALGAAAIIGKVLASKNASENSQVVPQAPPVIDNSALSNTGGQVVNTNTVEAPVQKANIINAFAQGGKPFKFLNSKYDSVTLIIQGTDGNPIGSNWVIAKSNLFDKPKHILFSGEKVTIAENQKVMVVTSDGKELSRVAFELEKDAIDGSYLWILK